MTFPRNPILEAHGGDGLVAIYSGFNSGTIPVQNVGAPPVVGGSDLLLVSGRGRLNTISCLTQVSGVAVTFYDAGVVTSGGPFFASGHVPLFVIPANTFGGGGANGGVFGIGPQQFYPDLPFFSGLAVAMRSGATGFSLAWSREP